MRRILTTCLLLQLAAVPGASAQEGFETEHRQRLAENPEGVALTVSLESGRRWFEMGEVVRLQLSFSSQIPDTYQLALMTYSRSGRLNVDLATVTPAVGAVDPLEDYFGAGLFAFVGGGALPPPEVLGQEPVSASLVLNEHLRFNRPGRYRLFVVSSRVQPVDQYSGLSVASNVIDLEILPADASWRQRQIAEAVAALRNDGDTTELEAACRVLRFVGTAEAVVAILDHYPLRAARSCQHEFSFGLIGAPPSLRDYVAREMMLRLRDPHYPIRPQFLRDLAFLTYLTQHPDYAVSAGTPLAAWADRRSAYDRILEQCVEDLANAITAKEGRALAISAMTLDDFREVFAHEFGHALGLISQRTRDRMLVQPPPWEQPTPDGVLETLFKLALYWVMVGGALLIELIRNYWIVIAATACALWIGRRTLARVLSH